MSTTTPARGRPLSPAGRLDRAALDLIEARGHLIRIVDEATEIARAFSRIDTDLRGLRDVVDGRAAA